eukprot:2157174-Amphidinium_carterae.1
MALDSLSSGIGIIPTFSHWQPYLTQTQMPTMLDLAVRSSNFIRLRWLPTDSWSKCFVIMSAGFVLPAHLPIVRSLHCMAPCGHSFGTSRCLIFVQHRLPATPLAAALSVRCTP